MGKQLFIGLAVEGNTDSRFLKSVVSRTFIDLVFRKSEQSVDIEVFCVKTSKVGKTFREFVADASKDGVEQFGVLIMAVHADSDKDTITERMNDKFIPAQKYLDSLKGDNYCRVITPIIPIKMIEAWMMADTVLLKDEIGTTLTDVDLGLHRSPETVADPKALIENAIRLSQLSVSKKRRNLSINDLYGIMGDEISLESLSRLPSYIAFRDAAENSLREIHYIP